MSTIMITCTTEAQVRRAKEIMADEVLHNPNLNGADYMIGLDDDPDAAPQIDSEHGDLDEYIGASLFSQIFSPENDA